MKRVVSPVSRSFCILSAIALTCLGSPVSALHEESFRVLVINNFDQRPGPFGKIADAFSSELLQREQRPIVIRYINLYAEDEQAISNGTHTRELIESVFEPSPADLVLALGPPAVTFWQNNLAESFGDVPILASATEVGGIDPGYIAGQWAVFSRYSFAGQIEEIRNLLPRTRHVFMVFGATFHERKLAGVAESQSENAFDDIELEFSMDMSLDETIERVSQLREGSVVYYVTPDTDATGELMSEEESFRKIRAASHVPVFGPFDNQLGQGIVGGSLIQLELMGIRLADLAFDILNGQSSVKGVHYIDLSTPMYDWRELEAWNIPLSRLPAGSQVQFTPPGPWDLYRPWIIAIALLIAAQAWLIVLWSIQRQRSRRGAAENVTLSTRLISAQEDERRLIARELHDDFSQRLARLSIDASVVASGARSHQNAEIIEGIKLELQQLSKDIHGLSYRLHPALLDELGLANAMRAECDRVRNLVDMEVVDRIDDFELNLPMSVQLNIYRIGQEALHNAVRHSAANAVEVELIGQENAVSLAVRDNGRGFDTAKVNASSSLGLLSMRERARLIGSTLDLKSRAGSGTTVQICVSGAA